jgi:hypothetical protein
MRFLKILAHVILSAGIFIAAFVSAIVLSVLFKPLFHVGDVDATATIGSMVLVLLSALLIPQWSRRVAIRKRLLAVLIGLLMWAFSTVITLLLMRLSPEAARLFDFASAYLIAISLLVTMGLIAVPWPVPVAALWRGEIPLVKTFWVWFTLVGGTLGILTSLISVPFYQATGSTFFSILDIAFSFLLFGYLAIATWRSARYYKGRRVWPILARAVSMVYLVSCAVFVVALFANPAEINALLLLGVNLPKGQ